MGIQELTEEYKRIVLARDQEIAAIKDKFQTQLDDTFENNPILKLFFNKESKVVFEGWETDRKNALVSELNKYGVKHTVRTNGYVEFYYTVNIEW